MLRRMVVGVSLLEMLIALGLIGMVLGAVLLRTRGVADQSRIETVRGELRAIEKGVDAYYRAHIDANGYHYYPTGNDWFSNDLLNDSAKIVRQSYCDPFRQGNAEYSFYKYANPQGKDLYYVIFSYGPDGAADIAGIGSDGKLTGQNDDDIFVTNGTGTF